MPRVRALTLEQRLLEQKKRARDICYMLMDSKRIKYVDIARLTGVTSQAVSLQFKNDSVQLETVMAVIYLADADAQKIEKIMKVRD